MKVLVTGGCGLIGSHIAEYYVKNGNEVVVLDNLERSKLLGHEVSEARKWYNYRRVKDMGCEMDSGDVSSKVSVDHVFRSHEGFDYVVHCAGQCGVPTSIADPRRDFEVNTLGTLNILENARKWNSRVVYASTNKVYPIHKGWDLYSESDSPRWRWTADFRHTHGWAVTDMMTCSGTRTPYGTSKYAGDLYCQEYTGIYGVPTGIFRMSCIYGEHQMAFEEQGWISWFSIALEKGLPLTIYGDGYQVRDVLHVSDVVQAYDAFLSSGNKGGVWNLGGGPKNTLSIIECIDMLQEIRGKKFVNIEYKDWRPSDQRVYTSDILPMNRVFSWRPQINPRDGMERIVEWVKKVHDVF